MNLYIHDLSLLDSGDFSDPFLDRFSLSHLNPSPSSWSSSSASSASSLRHDTAATAADQDPPPHRCDGTSPLPLGMDWTPHPPHPDQLGTVQSQDSRTGWSYWVTIPSWTVMPNSTASNRATFYRVQVGLQSPNAVASSREILRRFSDFLKLQSDLQKEFPLRKLPPAPPKRILKAQSKTLLEERRCSLENWIEQLLSDIYVSRSAAVGIFFELEASVRSFFDGVHEDSNSSVSDVAPPTCKDLSVLASSSFIASDHCNESTEETSNGGTMREGSDNDANSTSKDKAVLSSGIASLLPFESHKPDFDPYRHFGERSLSESASAHASDISNLVVDSGGDSDFLKGAETAEVTDVPDSSSMNLQDGLLVAFPSYERQNLKRVLDKVVQRLAIAKTDVEDLMGRLNQEVAVKRFLMTRVKDLEADLETTKDSCKESMEQAALKERERFTQMQWDIEELQNICFEKERKLEFEQAQREHEESLKNSLIKENEMLLKQFGDAKEELEHMHKQLEEVEVKSKSEVKLLVKEVKLVRGSNFELRQELSCLMKEKEDLESALLKEREEKAKVTTANVKLLHECEILCDRLRQCSVDFLVGEKNKIIVDSSSASDAIDLLDTSDSRIGLLLAEAQLLAQDVETSASGLNVEGGAGACDDATNEKLRKMLAETFINYARSKMEVNSVIRCTLNATTGMEQSELDASEEEEAPTERTVLSKILDR